VHVTAEKVLDLVLRVLGIVSQSKPAHEKFVPEPDTPLLGGRAVLTSLELVSFIVEVETRLTEDFGLKISLTDDRAFSQERSPFRRPSELVQYIIAVADRPSPGTA
jgi:hypothetical protein